MATFTQPTGWGQDLLTEFFDIAQNNEFATFDNKKDLYTLLRIIDDSFQRILENLINTPSLIPSFLCMRSHSAYRASCRLSMSGQLVESFSIGRTCIEYALYGFHMEKSPDSQTIWINRHNDEATKKLCRQEFTYRRIISTLESTDKDLSNIVSRLYERTIDYGGHPNERSVTSTLKILKGEGRTEFKQLYLLGDSLELDHGLKTIAQIGLCALSILKLIWPQRFDILGITAVIDRLKQKL